MNNKYTKHFGFFLIIIKAILKDVTIEKYFSNEKLRQIISKFLTIHHRY